MLLASTRQVVTGLRLDILHIRERELDFFLANLRNVALVSTLLSGLGYSGLMYTKQIMDSDLCGHHERMCSQVTYPLAVTATMCLAIQTSLGCTLLTMYGPALALHGHPEVWSFRPLEASPRSKQSRHSSLCQHVATYHSCPHAWSARFLLFGLFFFSLLLSGSMR